MPRYAAFIRGIGPTKPNMRNEKLCAAIKTVGASDVSAVLGTGNIVFSSAAKTGAALEKKIEQALTRELDLHLDVFVRSERDLTAMIASNPFKGKAHGEDHYLIVTFRKDGPPVFNCFDRRTFDGPEMMVELVRKYGKHQTTRTWATLAKVFAKVRGVTGE